jgi:hypothetical protein
MIKARPEHNRANVRRADLPSESRLSSSFGKADFADAFSVDLPDAASRDAEALARRIFAHPAGWVANLLKVRDILVHPLGLKRTIDLQANGGDRISIFRVFERQDREIILGEDDTHLDFRVSVLVQPGSQGRPDRLTVTTLVFYNRLLWRAYIALIAPFHRRVVRISLARAAKFGWPAR